MNSLKDVLKNSSKSNILVSICFGIFGIILCIFHEGAMKVISCLIGLLFMAVGVSRVITYIRGRGEGDYFEFDLFCGILGIIIGIVAIIYTDTIETVLRIIVAVWIIYSGFTKTYLSFRLKQLDSSIWLYSLVLAIIMIILGLYIILNTGAIIALIGTLMIIYSVIDIIEGAVFIKKIEDF